MKKLFFIVFIIWNLASFGQHNFLGKSQNYIEDFFKKDPIYYLRVDTLAVDNILLTFKSLYQYPYFTYEVDLNKDKCVSVGIVSKDKDVLDTYLDILGFVGTIVKQDIYSSNIIYEVKKNDIIRYYDIKQPYLKDENSHRRNLFYILIRERKNNNNN